MLILLLSALYNSAKFFVVFCSAFSDTGSGKTILVSSEMYMRVTVSLTLVVASKILVYT